jgi:hypothetical protein
VPIRAELRHFYRGPQWTAARRRILVRAGGRFDASGRYLGGAKCEQCGKPDRKRVFVRSGGTVMWWRQRGQARWRDQHGRFTPPMAAWPGRQREIRAQVGVAHLNHVAGDDRDDNLKALCNWCHLHHDRLQHRETRCARKDAARPLLQEAV